MKRLLKSPIAVNLLGAVVALVFVAIYLVASIFAEPDLMNLMLNFIGL